MKNLANETPMDLLHGRSRWIIENWLQKNELNNKRVLDIGTGFGWFEYNVKAMVQSVYGIEPEEKGLETARRYLSNEPNINLSVGSAFCLPFPDSFFDVVVAWDVIEHIPPGKEVKMLKEMERVLKNGGAMYITTPYRSFVNNYLDPAWIVMGHRHYAYSDVFKLIKHVNGVYVEDVFTKGGFWSIVNVWNLYLAKWIFHRKPFFQNWFYRKEDREWENKGGIFTLCVKIRKNQLG